MKVQDSLFKNINTNLGIFIFLVLNMFENLKDQRALKNKEKHGRKIGTKKRKTGVAKERKLVLQVSF